MKGNFMSIAKVSSILANRIRVIRNSKGWTQQRLAQEINIHPTYISRIESCNKLPTLYIISRIAEVLDVEAYELLLEEVGILRNHRIVEAIVESDKAKVKGIKTWKLNV